jgi:hypothetical protein
MILFALLFLALGLLAGLLLPGLLRTLLPPTRHQVQPKIHEMLEQMESQYRLRLLTDDLQRQLEPPRVSRHPPAA